MQEYLPLLDHMEEDNLESTTAQSNIGVIDDETDESQVQASEDSKPDLETVPPPVDDAVYDANADLEDFCRECREQFDSKQPSGQEETPNSTTELPNYDYADEGKLTYKLCFSHSCSDKSKYH